MTTPVPQPPAADAVAKPASKSGCFPIFLVFVGVGVVVCIVSAIVQGVRSAAANTENARGGAATTACEDAVRNQLGSPFIRRFTDEYVTNSDPTWWVTGDVLAQNSFGAIIPHAWTCTLTRGTGDTDFTVDSANVEK